jgi:hypothetical protein
MHDAHGAAHNWVARRRRIADCVQRSSPVLLDCCILDVSSLNSAAASVVASFSGGPADPLGGSSLPDFSSLHLHIAFVSSIAS